MHSKSNNIEIMIYDRADEVTKVFFESLLKRYQIGLETLMKGKDFIFDCVHSLHYQCHEINQNRGGYYYIVSSGWIENKNPTINPVNDDDKCFQFATIVALNHEEIGKYPEEYQKLKFLYTNITAKE